MVQALGEHLEPSNPVKHVLLAAAKVYELEKAPEENRLGAFDKPWSHFCEEVVNTFVGVLQYICPGGTCRRLLHLLGSSLGQALVSGRQVQ